MSSLITRESTPAARRAVPNQCRRCVRRAWNTGSIHSPGRAPGRNPESGFTLLFEALLIEFATAMSVARVAAMHQFGPGPPAPSSRRCRRPRRSPNGSVSRRSAPPGGTAPAAIGHRPDRRAGSSRRPRGQAAGHGLDGPRACRPRRSSRRRDTGRRPDIPSPSSASRSHRSRLSVPCDQADCWSSPFADHYATRHAR